MYCQSYTKKSMVLSHRSFEQKGVKSVNTKRENDEQFGRSYSGLKEMDWTIESGVLVTCDVQ